MLNHVIQYLYNSRTSGEGGRDEHEREINEDKVGEEGEGGVENTKKKKEKLEEKNENSKNLITTLIQNTVRAYVHGVCAVSLRATQALGDLHLVDKEEQGKRNKGDYNSLNFVLFFSQFF